MGTMRPNKYDVTSAYGLCQDYLPPDGGDFGCIMCSRRLCNNVTVCTQQSHTPSCRRNSLSNLRHFKDTKYNDTRPPGFCEQCFQNCTVRERDAKIFMLQQKLETCSIELQNTCYFNETIVHGYFVFRSVVDVQRRIGFTHRGKAVGPKKNVNDACYLFTKIQSDEFFQQHKSTLLSTTAATAVLSTQSLSMQRIKNKRRNQNLQLQRQQQSNGHNSNISLDLSSNNREQNQQKLVLENEQKQEHQQHHTHRKHHQVRHHHNNPDIIARRHHHDQKQKRKPHQRLRALTETTVNSFNMSVGSAATMPTTKIAYTLTQTPTKTPAMLTTTQLRVSQKELTRKAFSETSEPPQDAMLQTPSYTISASKSSTTASSKRKGRRRKHKKHKHNKAHGPGNMFTTETEEAYSMSSLSSAAWNDFTSSVASFVNDTPTTYSFSDWRSSSGSEGSTSIVETAPTSAFQLTSTAIQEDSFSQFPINESTNSINSTEVFNRKHSATTAEISTSETWSQGTFDDQTATTINYDSNLFAPTLALLNISSLPLSSIQTNVSSEQHGANTTSSNPTHFVRNTATTQRLKQVATMATLSKSNIENVMTTSTNSTLISNTIIDVNFTKWLMDYKSRDVSTSSNVPNDTVGDTGSPSRNPLTEFIYSTRSSNIIPNGHSDIRNKSVANTKALRRQSTENEFTTSSDVLLQKPIKTSTTRTFRYRNRTTKKLRPKLSKSTSPTASDSGLLQLLSPTPSTFTKYTNNNTLLTIDKNINNGHINNSLFVEKLFLQTTPTAATPLRITATVTSSKQLINTPEMLMQQTASSSALSTYSAPLPTTSLTTRKGVRKSTQKLLATPFHQLTTYVRNKAGDIDIDNIDNISVYPELAVDVSFDDYGTHFKPNKKQQHNNTELFNIYSNSNNSRLIVVSGYLPTSPSATLPTSLQIAKKKILNERQHRRSLRRFIGSSVVA